MNFKMKLSAAFLTLSLLPVLGHAGDLELAGVQAQTLLDTSVNQTLGLSAAKDAFDETDGCSIISSMFIRQPDLDEAVALVAPCLENISKRYGVRVSAERGIGLVIKIHEDVSVASPLFRDLSHALDLRNKRLFGHPVIISRPQFDLLDGTPANHVSSLQKIVDECAIIQTNIQPIKSAQDFLKTYEGCFAGQSAIDKLIATKEDGLTLRVYGQADPKALEDMNGTLSIRTWKGDVKIQVEAYPIITATAVAL